MRPPHARPPERDVQGAAAPCEKYKGRSDFVNLKPWSIYKNVTVLLLGPKWTPDESFVC